MTRFYITCEPLTRGLVIADGKVTAKQAVVPTRESVCGYITNFASGSFSTNLESAKNVVLYAQEQEIVRLERELTNLRRLYATTCSITEEQAAAAPALTCTNREREDYYLKQPQPKDK
jgi:hypothetical protein